MKKEYRIRKSEEFQKIITAGKKKYSSAFIMFYAPSQLDHDRIGISVGKKIGDAVERNKVKRQVRMMLQEISDFHSGYDRIFIIKTRFNNYEFKDNKKDLSALYNSVYNKQGQTY